MWYTIRTVATLFLLMTVITGFAYPLVVTGLSQIFFPHQANGSLIMKGDHKIASELVGQPFRSPGYFWGRPSATPSFAYNAASSSGSNLGPSNPDLRKAIHERIKHLLPPDTENRVPIPVDLVTTSASGLDPHISPAAALYQVPRVSRARGMDKKKLIALVEAHIQDRQYGIFGEQTVNVVRLNMALDGLP
jgi:K+-transporting ATPase ATPase C chain